MPPSTHKPQLQPNLVQGLTRKGTPASQKVRPPPLMRVVVEGWFGQHEEEKTTEELEKSERGRG